MADTGLMRMEIRYERWRENMSFMVEVFDSVTGRHLGSVSVSRGGDMAAGGGLRSRWTPRQCTSIDVHYSPKPRTQ